MSIRTRLAKLENPINNPCFKLAARLRIAKLRPREASPVLEQIAKLESSCDWLSMRLYRALMREIKSA